MQGERAGLAAPGAPVRGISKGGDAVIGRGLPAAPVDLATVDVLKNVVGEHPRDRGSADMSGQDPCSPIAAGATAAVAAPDPANSACCLPPGEEL